MFKNVINWLKNLFSATEAKVEDVLESASDELIELAEDINPDDDTKKRFVIEVEVGKDTKIRPLKAAMEVAIVEALTKSNPECKDVAVKSYYHKAA